MSLSFDPYLKWDEHQCMLIRLPTMTELEDITLDQKQAWIGMTKSKRRTLQNRINQRALRQRRATAVAGRDSEPHKRALQQEPIDAHGGQLLEMLKSIKYSNSRAAQQLQPHSGCAMGQVGGPAALAQAVSKAYQRYRSGQPDPSQFTQVLRFNVFYAFAHNASMLGFNDDWLKYEAISPLRQPHTELAVIRYQSLPVNMRPTELQFTVPHHPWIDFLPCSQMRHNFLEALQRFGEDAVDEDALCVDIVDAASARQPEDVCLVTWGLPWQLTHWEMTEAFMHKWAWLVKGCEELLQSTNYWRAQRDLPPIRLPDANHASTAASTNIDIAIAPRSDTSP